MKILYANIFLFTYITAHFSGKLVSRLVVSGLDGLWTMQYISYAIICIWLLATNYGILIKKYWAYRSAVTINAFFSIAPLAIIALALYRTSSGLNIKLISMFYLTHTQVSIIFFIFLIVLIKSKPTKDQYNNYYIKLTENSGPVARSRLGLISLILLVISPFLAYIIGAAVQRHDGSGAAWAPIGMVVTIVLLLLLTFTSLMLGLVSLKKKTRHNRAAAISITLSSTITLSFLIFIIRVLSGDIK